MDTRYVIGLDFGSDSVRALIVNSRTGGEVAEGVVYYPRWKEGKYSVFAESQFRHHPLDYIEAMTQAVQEALNQAPEGVAKQVVGIGVDTTGSTPAPVDEQGQVLALKPEFAENPNAMFVLWKDHTSVSKADLINELAHSGQFTDYTKFIGGIYSSEWFWAKAAWVSEQDPQVAEAAYSWVELCDWVPALLAGNEAPAQMRRGICAAGHKAMWHDSWNGLPDQAFLSAISPTLDGIRERMFDQVYASDEKAGELSQEWADKLGLPAGIAIAIGEFDCHMGAVGAGAGSYDLVKVIGTSTCDILMAPTDVIGERQIDGICGQVLGSSMPGLVALEAGQSAFGDLYAWYRRLLMWPIEQLAKDDAQYTALAAELDDKILFMLTQAAEQYQPELTGPIALDWHNGRRTPYANQRLTGELSALNLGTDAPTIFHSLVEATAHGAKAIMDCMTSQDVQVDRVLALGGIAKKSRLVMQLCADVMGRSIDVVESEQCCALGAAIFAAVAAGEYASTADAQAVMASPIASRFEPDAERHDFYQKRYELYRQLGGYTEELTETRTQLNS
ncbi:ribulokinase [Echinimonas agarilytica]|uniref:Ribulokinase n=1 Tax=Echinimonas agarilytica TaxID=1215918 RepID=A0AA41W3Q0_9GAMM|nr:ribulokinase [Echinimonas agarilytica]MCM2678226.1 ribulokinase [Echinimonas agarilytica]